MQLVANQQLVKNRVRLGLGFHITALAVFALGLVLSTQIDATRELPWESWAAILLGLVLYSLGQTQLRRWGPRNRQEEQLGQAIRSLDDRYKLYAFLSSSLPDYILVSPAGVHVLVVRQEAGQVTCERDRWNKSSGSRILGLFGPSLGNPSADAARQLNKLRELLGQRGMQDVPTSSLVVFTNPKAQLRIEGCTSTVTRIKELKDVLRRMAGKGQNVALGSARIREIQRIFDERMQAAHSWR
ncbi:MAG TPA: nuclease-related domain-containing protein [Chloroflexota bacterium]|nr:nuclease-related domain-containing protein [Chloroflexota bacterium]